MGLMAYNSIVVAQRVEVGVMGLMAYNSIIVAQRVEVRAMGLMAYNSNYSHIKKGRMFYT